MCIPLYVGDVMLSLRIISQKPSDTELQLRRICFGDNPARSPRRKQLLKSTREILKLHRASSTRNTSTAESMRRRASLIKLGEEYTSVCRVIYYSLEIVKVLG